MLPTLIILSALVLPAKGAGVVGKLDPPPVPAWTELKADPLLTTLTAPAGSKWIGVDDCELRPSADGATSSFAAAKPGRYRVLVVPPDGEPIRVAVLVGDAPPPEPPAPKPPDPKPPLPTDPLTAKLQIGYDADPRVVAAKKEGKESTPAKEDLLRLTELYRQAVALALAPDAATTTDLVTRLREAAKLLGINGLQECRKTIAAELSEAFPNADDPLTAETRKKAADLFAKIGESLKAVK